MECVNILTRLLILGLALLASATFIQAQSWSYTTRLSSSPMESWAGFGESVSAYGNRILAGILYSHSGGLAGSGRAIIFVKDGSTWSQEASITASNKGTDNHFGGFVSLSLDHALIGAQYASLPGHYQAGSAYVFVRSGTSWTEQAILTASDTQASHHFGCAVSIYQDYAMVGAKDHDSVSHSDSGSVYFFSRSGTQWNQQAILNSPSPSQDERFGQSVSVSSTTVLIGTLPCAWDTHCQRTGVAYIFTQGNSTWVNEATLSVSNQEAGNHFGISVSLDGDYAVVGARFADPDFVPNAGAAYVFYRQGASWSQQSALLMNPLTSGNLMGISVAIKGRVAIVGGPNAASQGFGEAGLVGAFYRTDSSWALFATWEANVVAYGNGYGRGLSLTDEYAAIGVTGDDFPGFSEVGSIQIILNNDYESPSMVPTLSQSQSGSMSASPSVSIQTGTTTTLSFETPSITSLTGFGSKVHMQGNRILISAPACISGRATCRGGGVFVVLKQGSGQLQQTQAIIYPGVASTTTTFGDVITTSGDWLAVSSKNALYSSVATGAVYLFYWNSSTQRYDRVRGLRARITQADLLFGSAVAMNGSYIAVGAPGYTHPITYANAGAVYFFTLQNNVWARYSVRISAPTLNVNEFFGSSLACHADLVAVGNRPVDTGLQAVYILQMTGARQWNVIQTLQDLTRDGFGWAVALVGSALAVSSNKDSSEGTEKGSVVIFEYDGTQFMDMQVISPIHHVADNLRFGHSISMTASTLAVGTDTCPNGSNCDGQGRAFVYTLSGSGTWDYRGAYKKGESQGADRFGSSVTMDGSTIVVGAPLGQGSRGRHGKTFVIDI